MKSHHPPPSDHFHGDKIYKTKKTRNNRQTKLKSICAPKTSKHCLFQARKHILPTNMLTAKNKGKN